MRPGHQLTYRHNPLGSHRTAGVQCHFLHLRKRFSEPSSITTADISWNSKCRPQFAIRRSTLWSEGHAESIKLCQTRGRQLNAVGPQLLFEGVSEGEEMEGDRRR